MIGIRSHDVVVISKRIGKLHYQYYFRYADVAELINPKDISITNHELEKQLNDLRRKRKIKPYRSRCQFIRNKRR